MTKNQFMLEAGRHLASRLKTLRAACFALSTLLALCLLSAAPARAAIGTADTVPAATLLVPYFEADLGNANGPQTSIRLTNASATAILVKAVLWTDYGVPTYNFPIYLTGFQSTDIDVRLLLNGAPPVTASAGQDPTDRISPKGMLSQDINFASCSGKLPLTMLPAATSAGLRNAHTGQSSTLLGGNCGGVAYGDNVARGYITFDLVNNCTTRIPGDTGYFGSGGIGDVTNQNLLTGSVVYLNRSQNLAFSEPLVSVEASRGSGVSSASNYADPLTNGTGANTFYGRYSGFTAQDNREALFSISQGRYLNGGVFSSGTQLVVWRDPGVVVTPFACGGAPAGFPLGQNEIVAFDEQEHYFKVAGSPFPYATQLVSSSSLSIPFTFGFLRLNLTQASGDPAVAGRQQSYVSMRYLSGGVYGGSLPAQQINNAGYPASSNFKIAP
jgi:hypothetical protein